MPPRPAADQPDATQLKEEDNLANQRNFSATALEAFTTFSQTYPLTPRLYAKFETRYNAARIAWMAGGMAYDGRQKWNRDSFHIHFAETRRSTFSPSERYKVRRELLGVALDTVRAEYLASYPTNALLSR
jgi:hypothetical protein